MSPLPAACSSRAAVFTASPVTMRCARARVARDDLAAVHADVVAELEPEVGTELRVQPLQRGLHVGGGADRAERVVLVPHGQPEHRHDRVADELLDGPAVPLERRRASRRSSATSRRGASAGPTASPVSEWTLGIAKTIVTVRRLSRATTWLSDAPQTVQKRIRSGFCSPQPGQMRMPGQRLRDDRLALACSLVDGDEPVRGDGLVRALRADGRYRRGLDVLRSRGVRSTRPGAPRARARSAP